MINTQVKLVFIDIPKTGSSALKTFLVRAFHEYTWQPSSNPAWINILCPKDKQYTITSPGKVELMNSQRHEPLISTFMHVNNLHQYYTFAIVRDPFERFKSAFIELIMFTRYKIPQTSASSPNVSYHSHLHDPWFIYPHHGINNHYDSRPVYDTYSLEEIQSKLIFNHLKSISNRGGFDKIGVCDIPSHFWPQYYFTALTLPISSNVVFIKYENLDKDFPVLREELSYFTGVDVTKEELLHIDPTCRYIFSSYNSKAINTMGYKFELEKEIHPRPTDDPGFCAKYPDFETFSIAYKEEKQRVTEHWLPTLENHRDMIEHLYAEDYRLHGYLRKS